MPLVDVQHEHALGRARAGGLEHHRLALTRRGSVEGPHESGGPDLLDPWRDGPDKAIRQLTFMSRQHASVDSRDREQSELRIRAPDLGNRAQDGVAGQRQRIPAPAAAAPSPIPEPSEHHRCPLFEQEGRGLSSSVLAERAREAQLLRGEPFVAAARTSGVISDRFSTHTD
jgi:hypothetical protein